MVDERESEFAGSNDRDYWTTMYPSFSEMVANSLDPTVLETGNPRDRHRPTADYKEKRARGVKVRDELRDKLKERNMVRIERSAIHRNEYGHVYTV